jgi:hypothetical protein
MGCTSTKPDIPDAPPVPHPDLTRQTSPLANALKEMRVIRKVVHDKKENEQLRNEGKATQCADCGEIMPHITTRKCTCHSMSCDKHNPNSSCTIFRKVSRLSE